MSKDTTLIIYQQLITISPYHYTAIISTNINKVTFSLLCFFLSYPQKTACPTITTIIF